METLCSTLTGEGALLTLLGLWYPLHGSVPYCIPRMDALFNLFELQHPMLDHTVLGPPPHLLQALTLLQTITMPGQHRPHVDTLLAPLRILTPMLSHSYLAWMLSLLPA